MISYIDLNMYLDAEQLKGDSISIIRLRQVIESLENDNVLCIDKVVAWQPQEKSITITEDDLFEDQPPIELGFVNIDAVETMHTALESILKHHYTKGLEKLK